MRQTTMLKPSEVVRQWYIVDGTDCTLGRLATQVATLLRGKHKPAYTPHVDCGDYVIVINADKIKISGDQDAKKFYYSHSMYPGGLVQEVQRLCVKTTLLNGLKKPSRVCYHITNWVMYSVSMYLFTQVLNTHTQLRSLLS